MPEPDWLNLLVSLYESKYAVISIAPEEEDNEYRFYHPAGGDIEPDERQKAARFLEDRQLIEQFQDYGEMRLSKLGIEVAHQHQLAKEQEQTNHAIVVFTLAIVLVEIVAGIPWELGGQALVITDLPILAGLPYLVIKMLGYLAILLGIGYLSWFTDYLEKPFGSG